MLRMRLSAAVLISLSALTISGCDSSTTSLSLPNIPTLAARLYTLQPSGLPAYTRDVDTPLTPAVIADQLQQPNLQQVLINDGMVSGDEAEYAPQSGQAPPFDTINSQALVFNDASGATSYFAGEQKRIDVAPNGGTIAPLQVSTKVADASAAYFSTVPAGTSTDRAYIFLARKGRVLVELFGHPKAGAAADSGFQDLVTMQDKLLATSPDVKTTN
jgi:hypothetical protein